MHIFDTFGSTWNQILPFSSYVPDQRKVCSSTFKDGKIYYVGGVYQTDKVIDIREILIYDTSNENSPWSLKIATNITNISNRFFHSAVLDNIIIFGGTKEFSDSRNSSLDYTLNDYLISLNLETFELSELKTLNKPSIYDIPYITPIEPPTPPSPTPPIKIIIISIIGSPVFIVAIVTGFIFIAKNVEIIICKLNQPNTALSHNTPVNQHTTTFDHNTTFSHVTVIPQIDTFDHNDPNYNSTLAFKLSLI
ncbi:10481_t:CDS:2 [Ambispora gerdemannii]|uniref:10481_t:CDS:1 n=1 Tax=Ambispora gerdemannii TaxID=144530 RepID=A0A9N9E0N1_9GLOM|nr:10481_t:CDS:2 [Ambispora gerdemannii]